MKKIYLYVGVCVVALVFWVYWSSNNELKYAVLFIKDSNLINDFLIYPSNATCQSKLKKEERA